MADFSSFGGASSEWLAVQAGLATPAPGQTLKDLKKATNDGREAVSAQEMLSLAPLVDLQDLSLQASDGYTLEARLYHLTSKPLDASTPLVVHLHGGGHLFGTLSSEDAACARIVVATGVCVFNLNYRHTPEFTYPTPWLDVETALRWLHSEAPFPFDASKVILEGISAGAWMTASHVLAQRLRTRLADCPPIAGQILMIPCLAHYDCFGPQLARLASPNKSSKEENKNAPILPIARIAQFLDLLKVQDLREDDLFLNPGNATVDQVRNLPPTVIGVAGLDPLRDEALLYGRLLEEAGYVSCYI
jgi:acetyl esterase/lipase